MTAAQTPICSASSRLRTGRRCRSRTGSCPTRSCAGVRPTAGLSRAVLAEPRIETAVAVIGALPAGVPVVPINPRSGTGELAHIVDDAEPEALLVRAGTRRARGVRRRAPAWSRSTLDGRGGARRRAAAAAGRPRAPALIVYTSGTTGPPKGAVLPRRAIASNLDALADAWEWTERRRRRPRAAAVPRPRAGDRDPRARCGAAGRRCTWAASPPRRSRAALAGGATMLFGVPTMYRRLADAAEESARAGRGAGRRAAAGVGLGGAARRRARAAAAADRPRRGRALRDDRDADEHRDPRRRRAAPGHGRPAAARRRAAAGRRRRRARSTAPTTRRSARSRSAGRTCSSAT